MGCTIGKKKKEGDEDFDPYTRAEEKPKTDTNGVQENTTDALVEEKEPQPDGEVGIKDKIGDSQTELPDQKDDDLTKEVDIKDEEKTDDSLQKADELQEIPIDVGAEQQKEDTEPDVVDNIDIAVKDDNKGEEEKADAEEETKIENVEIAVKDNVEESNPEISFVDADEIVITSVVKAIEEDRIEDTPNEEKAKEDSPKESNLALDTNVTIVVTSTEEVTKVVRKLDGEGEAQVEETTTSTSEVVVAVDDVTQKEEETTTSTSEVVVAVDDVTQKEEEPPTEAQTQETDDVTHDDLQEQVEEVPLAEIDTKIDTETTREEENVENETVIPVDSATEETEPAPVAGDTLMEDIEKEIEKLTQETMKEIEKEIENRTEYMKPVVEEVNETETAPVPHEDVSHSDTDTLPQVDLSAESVPEMHKEIQQEEGITENVVAEENPPVEVQETVIRGSEIVSEVLSKDEDNKESPIETVSDCQTDDIVESNSVDEVRETIVNEMTEHVTECLTEEEIPDSEPAETVNHVSDDAAQSTDLAVSQLTETLQNEIAEPQTEVFSESANESLPVQSQEAAMELLDNNNESEIVTCVTAETETETNSEVPRNSEPVEISSEDEVTGLDDFGNDVQLVIEEEDSRKAAREAAEEPIPSEEPVPETEGGEDPVEKGNELEDRFYNNKAFEKPDVDPGSDEQQDAALTIQTKYRQFHAKKVVDKKRQDKAAVKIQAGYRGWQDRKAVKTIKSEKEGNAEDVTEEEEPETMAAKPEEEVDIDINDPKVSEAAVKIQSSYRGFKARKDIQEQKDDSSPQEEETQEKQEEPTEPEVTKEEEEVDIDLNDPEVAVAASKIQAVFRGHQTRKDTQVKKDIEESRKEDLPRPESDSEEIAEGSSAPQEVLEEVEEKDSDKSPEEIEAATKIQAGYRGMKARGEVRSIKEGKAEEAQDDKQEEKQTEEAKEESKEEDKKEDEEVIDIDLTDPEVEKAAIRIQATMRGFKVRKENEENKAAAAKDGENSTPQEEQKEENKEETKEDDSSKTEGEATGTAESERKED